MQITIVARHGHLSPINQEKITEKIEPVRKFFDRITSIQVIVDVEHKEMPSVEVRVMVEGHHEFVALEAAESLFTAVDLVVDKIEGQLRKHKEKLKEHRATSHKHLEPPTV